MTNFVIVDLDGCTFDDRRRLHLIRKDMPDCPQKWEVYHAACSLDSPIYRNFDLVLKYCNHHFQGNFQIHFFTSRPAAHEIETEFKIRNVLPEDVRWMLHMRPNDNEDSPVHLKYKMLRHLQNYHGEVKIAFDDQEDICHMYVKNGVKAIQMSYDARIQKYEC